MAPRRNQNKKFSLFSLEALGIRRFQNCDKKRDYCRPNDIFLPRGLTNRSNFCFVNSILQALLACVPMVGLLHRLLKSSFDDRKAPVASRMCDFLYQYSEGNQNTPTEPKGIHNLIGREFSSLRYGMQEDAEEFLSCLLNHLSQEIQESIQNLEDGPTPEDIFQGRLRSEIHRTGGEFTATSFPFFTLALDIHEANTLSEALEILTSRNKVDGVSSGSSSEETEAWQRVILEQLPSVLILQLKCFYFEDGRSKKLIKTVDFPMDLSVDSSLTSDHLQGESYQLFAVVSHVGSDSNNGHYITDAFHGCYGSWVRFDDSCIREIDEEFVLHPEGKCMPYLLFYRQI